MRVSVNSILREDPSGCYVSFYLHGKLCDEAGPFDDPHAAMEAARRGVPVGGSVQIPDGWGTR